MLSINYNANVKVKLDERGKQIYKQQYAKEPLVDNKGYSEFPLWVLMFIFGPTLKAGTSFTEDGNIYMQEKDVKANESANESRIV